MRRKRLRKARRDVKLAFLDKQKMKMHYKHISKEERRKSEKLTQVGSSNKKIAEELGRSASTIGWELKRNCWCLKCREYRIEVANFV